MPRGEPGADVDGVSARIACVWRFVDVAKQGTGVPPRYVLLEAAQERIGGAVRPEDHGVRRCWIEAEDDTGGKCLQEGRAWMRSSEGCPGASPTRAKGLESIKSIAGDLSRKNCIRRERRGGRRRACLLILRGPYFDHQKQTPNDRRPIEQC